MTYTKKEYKQRISLGQSNNALTRLVIVVLVVFTILYFTKAFYFFLYRNEVQTTTLFYKKILQWFVLPANLSEFARKPWTLLTSMFVHIGVWAVFANMLWLWTFGYIMQDLTGNRKIIPIFIYGGLAAAISFLAVYNLVPSLQPLSSTTIFYGATAGVTAVAIATTLVAPQYRIFPLLAGGFPLWILTLLYLGIAVASTPLNNMIGYLPHVAGGCMGAIFILLVRRGYDWSEWMNNLFDWVNNLFNPDKPKKGKDIKEELFYKSATVSPYKKTPNITQQRIDDILDKINQKGYSFLTDEEKELLKRASKEDI